MSLNFLSHFLLQVHTLESIKIALVKELLVFSPLNNILHGNYH